MYDTKTLINKLRQEHAELSVKIAAGEFALETLPLDTEEKELLAKQLISMTIYADTLKFRAKYATKKEAE